MINVGVSIDSKKLQKKLLDIQRKQIPFATSRAMQMTVAQAKADAAKAAALKLDDPTKGLTETKVSKGWIRAVWPSKSDVKRDFKRSDGKSAEARVFIIDPLVNEIHALTFGGRQTRVPDRSDVVVQPTRALLKGLQGSGRLKSLNKYGNIRGFARGALSQIKSNKEQYLNVSMNNSDPKTRHLAPGLYFKGREITRDGLSKRKIDKRLSRSKRQLTPAQRRKGLRVRNYLIMLLSYESSRTMPKGKWKYNDVVVASFKKNAGQNFRRELAKAIATSR